MTFDAVFSNINTNNEEIVLRDNAHKSLHVMKEEEFYVEPSYKEIKKAINPRFILVSAPGASGKSAMARHVSWKYNLLLWDLSEITLGENTFMGTMLESFDEAYFVKFRESFKRGTTTVVIDAFDEANVISGWKRIEYLIGDIIKASSEANRGVAILFARTETAHRIAEYFSDNKVLYSHYEIGFVPEHNAKDMVKEQIRISRDKKSFNTVNDAVVNKCLDEQFSLIKKILGDNEETISFLGYPPVLQALGESYSEDNNLVKLLTKLSSEGLREGSKLISNILGEILEREQSKMSGALREGWENKFSDFNDYNRLYSPFEQMIRVMEYVVLGSVDTFYRNDNIEEDVYADYITKVKEFIPEHPFIQKSYKNGAAFTGPAFSQFVLAKLVSCDECEMLIDEYYSNPESNRTIVSPLFFDIFTADDKPIADKYYYELYKAFKSKENNDKDACIRVYDEDGGVFCEFGFRNTTNDSYQHIKTTEILIKSGALGINDFVSGKINIPYEIRIGENERNVSIVNSSIEAKKVTVGCNRVFFKANKKCGCIITSKEPINASGVDFDVEETVPQGVLISAPDVNNYYNLKKHKFDGEIIASDELLRFAMIVDKILDCMRKHGKDVPAKERDYIENEIISGDEYKKSVILFLMDCRVIYIDKLEPHLYKLDVDVLSEYELGWQSFVFHGVDKFVKMYRCYKEFAKE